MLNSNSARPSGLLAWFCPIICSLLPAAALSQSLPFQQVLVNHLDKDTIKHPLIFDLSKRAPKTQSNDTLKLIVRLSTEPVMNSAGRQRNSLIQEQHDQFKADLTRLSRTNARMRTASTYETVIRHEYSKVFNGFAITTARSVADEIRKLPYVASVSEDKEVKASYTDNNHVIRAPEAWQHFGVTGKNVTIGILDTGIDYNHPDLGQGFGTTFKVIGGYDFVNTDSDPMDDHGHGTHVAGIAAANGVSFKGVAPDAKLVAYKVLNQYGNGLDSWILAAIERAVDPDQNPATDDALDIVNMSLGRPPDATEPLSHAVNNAVANGVVFCIAAGNRGQYSTIDTPGIAEHAITVGATDNNKYTANFSSKGPTPDLLLKPDVSAPGSGITSTYLNKQYQSFDGTSMSSPHVAGAAALLLERWPQWTPAIVKSALMGTARSSSSIVWDQGAGVIDIYAALNTPYFTSPGSIHFGTVASSSSLAKTIEFTVTNTANEERSFNINVEGMIGRPPFSFDIVPASFSLSANESQTVQLTLSSALPVALQNLPDAYSGAINIASQGITVKTPAVFLNPQKTILKFSGELPGVVIVMGIEGSYYWTPYYPTDSSLQLHLPKGKYDILTHYEGGRRAVITEGVNTEQNVDVTLEKSLAKNMMAFKPVDQDGLPLAGLSSINAFFTGENRNIMSLFFAADTLYVSDTEHYGYEFKYAGKSETEHDAYYDVTAVTGMGIAQSVVLSNNTSRFNNITIRNPSIPAGSIQHLTYHTKAGFPYTWYTTWNSYPIEMPATFTLKQTQVHPESYYIGSFAKLAPLPEMSGYVWETGDIRSEEDNTISFYQFASRKILSLDQQDFDYVLGTTLPYFYHVPEHQESIVRLSPYTGPAAFNRAFGERERGTIDYKLSTDANVVIKKGQIKQPIYTESGDVFADIEVSPGTYNLDFEYRDFQTGGKFGLARLRTRFNTAGGDKNPPYIKALRLISNDRDANELKEGEGGTLSLTISECEYCTFSTLKSVSLSIKGGDTDAETPLNLATEDQRNFSASLPDLAAGYYSLKLMAEDLEGNSFTYDVAPAFLVGERVQPVAYTAINLISPRNYSINAGTQPVFKWSAIDAASYMIQIADDPAFSENVIEGNATEPTYVLSSPLEENKTYYWRVKGLGENAPDLWSVVFQFEAKFLPLATLLSPAHEAIVPFTSVDLVWAAAPNAYRYVVEVSWDEDFSSPWQIAYTDRTTFTFTRLYPNTKYYWRVKSYFFSGWSDEESVSLGAAFETEPLPDLPQAILESPSNEGRTPFSVVDFTWSSVPDAYAYRLEVSRREDFAFVEKSHQTDATVSSVTHLLPNTTYFWRIKSLFYEHWLNAESVSTTSSFTTESLPAPHLVEPANGSVHQPLSLLFTWEASASASDYIFELSRDETFSSILISRSRSSTSTFVEGLVDNAVYYWRVTPRYVGIRQAPSTPNRFKSVSLAPSALLSPADNAVDVPSQLELKWSAVENGNNNYVLEVSRSADFNPVDIQLSTSDTIYTLITLEPFTSYFWRITTSILAGSYVYEAPSENFTFRTAAITGLVTSGEVHSTYSFPNPFKEGTEIIIESTAREEACVQITDILGRTIKSLSLTLQPGRNSIYWDGSGANKESSAPGLYYANFVTENSPPVVIRLVKVK